MGRGSGLLLVAVAAVAGLVLLPESLGIWILLVLMFVAGWLSPEHPVATATALAGLCFVPGFVLLVLNADSWFTHYWHGYNPLSFDLVPALLLVAVDLVVNVLVSWGWMVFAAYMGAGIALRLRIRAAN